jgi:hypothetical protein
VRASGDREPWIRIEPSSFFRVVAECQSCELAGSSVAGDMTYDPKDGYGVLFGGDNNSSSWVYGDTWKFQNGNWTNITPSLSPSARGFASMTYDAQDGYVLLFGGGGGAQQFWGDT